MQKKYQEKFGYPIPRTAGKVRPQMAPWIQEFIRHSPFWVLATSNANPEILETLGCRRDLKEH